MVHGRCTSGCVAGYHGEHCVKKCPSNCRTSATGEPGPCDQQSGQCSEGCDQGYLGVYCNQACNKSQDGCKNVGSASFEGIRNIKKSGWVTCGSDPNGVLNCLPGCTVAECEESCWPRCHKCDRDECTDCGKGWYGSRCDQRCPASCTWNDCDMRCICREVEDVDFTRLKDDNVTSTPSNIAETHWNPTLVMVCSLLIVFALVMIGTISCLMWSSEKTMCCNNSTEPVAVSDPVPQIYDVNGFPLNNRSRRRDVSDSDREDRTVHHEYLLPVHQDHPDVRGDNNEYYTESSPRRQIRSGRSHYDVLNFEDNGDPDHLYHGLSQIHTSQL